jgi:hypothetical protein
MIGGVTANSRTERLISLKPVVSKCHVILVLAAYLALILCLFPGNLSAHEIRPAIATLGFDEDGGVKLIISLNLEAVIAGIGPGHENTDDSLAAPIYDRLRALPAQELSAEWTRFVPSFLELIDISFDGRPFVFDTARAEITDIGNLEFARITRITLEGTVTAPPDNLSWGLDPLLGDSVLRLRATGSEDIIRAEYIPAGQLIGAFTLKDIVPQSRWQVFSTYLYIGYTHILPKGLDHILFVVGLFLLSTRIAALFWQVTAFTLAHSITLALGILEIVQIPSLIVEPIIAASIIYVSIENLITDKLKPWRPLVVFGFGLVHGLGFADVLAEIGFSKADFMTGLIGFNLGVELGQLSVIAICFGLVGFWFHKKAWYRAAVTIPASITIGLIAFYLLANRLFF